MTRGEPSLTMGCTGRRLSVFGRRGARRHERGVDDLPEVHDDDHADPSGRPAPQTAGSHRSLPAGPHHSGRAIVTRDHPPAGGDIGKPGRLMGSSKFVDVRLIAEHPSHDREPGSPATGDDSGPRAAHPGVVLPTCGELVKPSGQWALRGQGVGRGPPEVPLATSMQLDADGPGGAGSPAGLDQHATMVRVARPL